MSRQSNTALHASSYVPAYMAVHVDGGVSSLEEEALHTLPLLFTSRVMRWTDDIWLLDLTVCRSYWAAQAQWQNVSIETLFTALLTRHAGNGLYSAALADHPWQAIVLLIHMRERALPGLINYLTPFGAEQYRQIGWSSWFRAASVYGRHCGSLGTQGFNPSLFRRALIQLLKAMQRLGQKLPFAMADAQPIAIRRRYGAHVALLWEWTFAGPGIPSKGQITLFREDGEIAIRGFPWVDWTPPHVPTVTRHLEYPVWAWEHIAPLLVTDFDRLCALNEWRADESVVHIVWTLTCTDNHQWIIDVRFRHPHHLHAEQGEHATAVLQAHYAFLAHRKHMQPQGDTDHADAQTVSPIMGWTCAVMGRMKVDCHALHSARIENQLPVPVERFVLAADWQPEASFASLLANPSADHQANDDGSHWGPWLAMARRRPLYMYHEPVVLSDREVCRRATFMERTSMKWWHSPTDIALERDYFIIEDPSGKCRWAYRDTDGHWCVYGVFG